MSAARPAEGALLPLGGTARTGEGGNSSAARPPEGARPLRAGTTRVAMHARVSGSRCRAGTIRGAKGTS
jgi:hypothetical protein